MVGICLPGVYIPRTRLSRKKIFEAMGWLNAATRSLAKGEKSISNYDEDSLTMAVSATMECGVERNKIDALYFASTTMSYQERQNSGIIAAALGTRENVRTADFSGSLKAGTTALISAFESIEAGGSDNTVVCVSDCRLAGMGSLQEMMFGDAATALPVGRENVIAEYKGSFSLSADFVDYYRGRYSRFGRGWEDRWIRDAGYDSLIPVAIDGLLKKYNLNLENFSTVIYPCPYPSERKKLNKKLALRDDQVQEPFMDKIGDAGTAQPLLMLVAALEKAKPGDEILVLGFGNGCDAIWLTVTEGVGDVHSKRPFQRYLNTKIELDSYEKYLVWRDMVPYDAGLRAEHDIPTRWSLAWRLRKSILGFCGSKCRKCGTPQFPPQRVCVNPSCGAVDDYEDYYFSDKEGKVSSFTGDNLAASINPPQVYGHIVFDGGGKVLMDLTDCSLESLQIGKRVEPVFRIKRIDRKRDTVVYGWKVRPIEGGE